MTGSMGFLWRWVQAFGVLAAMANPWGWDFVTWAWATYTVQPELVAGLGAALILALAWLVWTALRGFGTRLSLVLGLVLGTAGLVIVEYDLLGGGRELEPALGLICGAAVLAFGRWRLARRQRRAARERALAQAQLEARLRHPDLDWSDHDLHH